MRLLTVQKKTLAIIGLTLIGLVLVIYAALATVLVKGFGGLEEVETVRQVQRVLTAISGEVDRLTRTAQDWAEWDETYSFMENSSPAYATANLNENTPARLKINLLVLVRTSGAFAYSATYDNAGLTNTLPDGFNRWLSEMQIPPAAGTVSPARAGLMQLPDGNWLVSVRPVLTSQGQGPARGTLIMGRRLDARLLERLAGPDRVSASVHRYDEPTLPADLLAFRARRAESPELPVGVRPLNDNLVAGYTLLKDTLNRPALLLKVETQREIYRQGQLMLVYLLVALGLAGLLFEAVAVLLLNRLVVSRLEQLSREVAAVVPASDMPGRVTRAGKDELADLAGAINSMLDSLEQAQREQQRLNRQLAHQAQHDSLTGLPNRTLFEDRLRQALIRCERNRHDPAGRNANEMVAVVFIDLDRFKPVNDQLGHKIGDLLLREVAQRLQECVRQTDTVARTGGDEFILVLSGLHNRTDAEMIATKILKSLAQSFTVQGYELSIGASIGISLFPEDGCEAEELTRKADQAMYRVKQGGRNDYRFYSGPVEAHAK